MKPRSKQFSTKKVAKSADQQPHVLDDPFPFAERCSESKRAPGVHAPTELEPFEIITLPNGKKTAKLRAGLGWGNKATATFIYDKGLTLRSEITLARSIWRQYDSSASPGSTAIETVHQKCPTLSLVCNASQLIYAMTSIATATPLETAIEILCDLFPTCTEAYVRRCTRRRLGTSSK